MCCRTARWWPMPIRARNRLRIQPSAPRTTAAVTAAALPGTISLNVPHVYQQQNEWCWAACTQMIAAFLGNANVKQCDLANFLQDRTDCCRFPASDVCNQPCPLQDIVPVYQHMGIHALFDTHAATPAV